MKATKMFKFKKITAGLMAVIMTLGAGAYTAVNNTFTDSSITVSAADYRTGRFQNDPYTYTGFTYLYSNDTFWSAKAKICTFDLWGWRSGSTVDVEVYSSNGRYIKTETVRSGNKITLPRGYYGYKLRLRAHNYGGGWWNDARNFENSGGCVYWSIDASSNCRF